MRLIHDFKQFKGNKKERRLMTIASITFVFIFLPVSLIVYYLVGDGKKEYILLALSLFFYACGSLETLVLFVMSICINVLIGRGIIRTRSYKILPRLLLWSGIVLDVGLLAYYKYSNFVLINYGRLLGQEVITKNLIIPLGISFFSFKEISYLVDVYTGKAAAVGNPVRDALYISFFAQVQSGPILRYNQMQRTVPQDEDPRRFRFNLFADGVAKFVVGFNKKILLADVLHNITKETFSASAANMSISYAWLGAICFSLQLYYDFSGYSDMAIGITQMFGYTCDRNFNYPYITSSVSEFWRRWHISLGSWFKDYIYIPLGGSRVKERWRLARNLLVVWVLTGIWHGASWNFVFWGLAYFVMIAFEKFTGYPQKIRSKVGKALYRVFVLLFINFEWVIFNAPGLRAGLKYIKNMFLCPDNPLADSRMMFMLKDNLAFIICAVIFCLPVVPYVENKLANSRYGKHILDAILVSVNIFLFVWAVSFVLAGHNNPFAYANF